jgi:prepilin-type N-terminal cleavage/methylation domain-containing protein
MRYPGALRCHSLAARAGFTLLEVTIALVILALLAANVRIVSESGAAAVRSGAMRSSLENELELTLERITFALMSARDSEIEGPVPAPMPSSFVRFAAVLGRDASGKVLTGPTEQIAWAPHDNTSGGARGPSTPVSTSVTREGGRVMWTENADVDETRRITWSNAVPTAYMGEVDGNAEDDNGNDLLDEGGLAFAREGSEVRVLLTVERIDEHGRRQPVERSLRIAPRN